MALLPQIKELISEVERLSGRKVVVQEDSSLPILSTVQTARGAAPFHMVLYRMSGETVNYLVAYQLAFLVRLFSCPKDERWEIASSAKEQALGIQQLGMSDLSPAFASSMLGNLIT